VVVSIFNITTEEGCEELIKHAIEHGPVGAIFHLAAVLRDGIFENLDEQMFNESLAPKALGTKYLDKVSRVLCPDLEQFVVFSSVSCGRGNAGQSNYGMANSVMERIIEDRNRDGLPGKAIQWGAIGDVGMLADYQLMNVEKDFGGTLPQSINSCLEVLDILLTSNNPIVSSMIVADKKLSDLNKGNIIDMIFKIMGIRDRKSVSMDSTLTQLGIDSLTGVEIQYIIEREFDLSLTSQELRSLTLSQLEKRVSTKDFKESEMKTLDIDTSMVEKVEWMRLLMEGVVDPKTLDLVTSDTIVNANDIQSSHTKILIVPGFFGFASNVFKNIGIDMDYPAYILQYVNFRECTNLDEIMKEITPIILELYSDVDNFLLIGHSYGCILTLKMAEVLEDSGKSGQIIQLDGSPILSNNLALQALNTEYYSDLNNYISMMLFKFYQKHVDQSISKTAFEGFSSWTERFKEMIVRAGDSIPLSHEYMIEKVSSAYMYRLDIAANFKNQNFLTLKTTKIALIKATKAIVKEISNDYGLSQFSNFDVVIKFVSGDHVTILLNSEISRVIKEVISV